MDLRCNENPARSRAKPLLSELELEALPCSNVAIKRRSFHLSKACKYTLVFADLKMFNANNTGRIMAVKWPQY